MTERDQGKRGDLEFGTIPRLVGIAAERHRDRVAIEDGDVVLSYAELAVATRRAARGLMALGIEAGDRVAIWAPNVAEWIVAALAVHSVGAALVPLNTRYKGAEAAYVLEKSGARVLFTVNGFLDTDYVALLRAAEAQGASLPALGQRGDAGSASGALNPRSQTRPSIVILRGDAPAGTLAWSDLSARGDAISDAAAEARAAAVSPESLSDIIFTSGTTGHPKGVMCTHAQTLRAFRDWADTVGLREGDRYLIVLPFFHSFGYKAGWLASLMMGATIFPQAVFDVGAVLERVGRDKITVLPGPPALYQTILARPDLDRFDLSSLRLAVTGAAVIPVELIHRMRDRLTFETIITGYGLTEATGVCTMCRYDDDPETVALTSGRAIPDVDVRVVDDQSAQLPRGEAGEIVVRGYNVTRGYLDDPEQTAEAIDGEGFLRTGDIGIMDARGYLKITDRKKDMFIVGGFNAYPAEIENALLTHEAVARAAVIGIPDERLGEVGMAFVVLKPGAALDEAALIAWCRERMANYKVPRTARFVADLPVNATGKVLKFELRRRAAGER